MQSSTDVMSTQPISIEGNRLASFAVRYVPSLDGLRALSILLVVFAHLGKEGLIPGGFGVTLFFFISGLLITGQLAAELQRKGHIDFGNFYLRRALRLLPAGFTYITVAGVAFILAGGVITAVGWLCAYFYAGNYYDLFAMYKSTIPGVRHPYNHIWSLAIEEQFYMMWPISLLLLSRGGLRRPAQVLMVLCAAVMAWRIYLFHDCLEGSPDSLCGINLVNRLYKATDTRIDSIAWGALATLLIVDPRASWYRKAIQSRLTQAAMLLLLLSTFLIRGEFYRESIRYSMQGISLSILVPAVIASESALRRMLELAPLVFIGRLSYSMYLWHWSALSISDYLTAWPKWQVNLLVLLLTAMFSLASYFVIERPMLRLRKRFGSSAPDALKAAEPVAATAESTP